MTQHSQHEPPQPPPETLLKTPSVTIYLDGLMVFFYCKEKYLFQAGIHIDTCHPHHVKIRFKERGQEEDLQCLILDHEQVKKLAPFLLYVEEKEGACLPSGAATLYKPDDPRYRHSFANVLDFHSDYFHQDTLLGIKPNTLAPVNILNGEFYSAMIDQATRYDLQGNSLPVSLGYLSTRVAADIPDTSGNLILRSSDPGAELRIKLTLCPEKQYEVYILNEPIDHSEPNANHTHANSAPSANHNDEPRPNHFPEYYNALDLRAGARKFTVNIADIKDVPGQPAPLDPPCIGGRCSRFPELPQGI